VRNVARGISFRSTLLLTSLTVGLVLLLVPALAPGQAFVQVADNGQPPPLASTTTVTFTKAQGAGDLNVVVVGWSDTTSSVTGVTDTAGNTYAMAAGTNAGSGVSESIFYAANIASGANTITVNFRTNAAFPDVRALEYSGVSKTGPLNISAGAAGSGTSANSGSATTTVAHAVIVAGGTTTQSFNNTGANFKIEDYTLGSNIAGENIVTVAGTYNVTATLGVSAPWVMQLAAFGKVPSTFPAPTLGPNPVSPASGNDSGGDAVTITGTNFAPGAVVLFGAAGPPPTGISGVNCAVTSSTTISCTTPADNTGPKDVTVLNPDGQFATAVGAFTYTAVTPTITSITPPSDFTNGGTAITISGTNFVSPVSVTFDGIIASNVVDVSSTTITANTTAHAAGTANVVVKNLADGGTSVPFSFTYSLGTGPINFIQSADSGPAVTSSSGVLTTMPLSQTAGDLNVVAIGWSDALSHTITVQDSEGNTYTQALTPTIGTDTGQVIYYAKDIKGGGPANAITVTFSPAAAFPDVRAAEYSGLDPNNPLDKAAGNSGTNGIGSSGPITVAANELVVGAGTTDGAFTGSGTGFATVDITANGNDVEHQVAPPAGSVTATAPVSGNWVMQAVAFLHGAPVPDFSFTPAPSPASNTVTAGRSASYTISVSALNGFSSAVSLSCSAGLPTGATCSFSPPSVTPGSAPATSALTISTTTATPGGTSTVTITGTSGSTSHTTSVSLVVHASTTPDFAITATALSPATVSAGGSATSTITITPVASFNGSVSLACSSITGGGTPAPTCLFSSTSVPGSGTSTLTITTTANTKASLAPHSTGILYALLLPISGITLLGAGLSSRRKKLLGVLLLCMVIAGIVFMSACGGGNSGGGGGGGGGTPAGTYTITVTGTSGSLTHNAQTLTLTVQ
jgi:hypothetical protein